MTAGSFLADLADSCEVAGMCAQVLTEYSDEQLPLVLEALERLEAHLTAAVVSNDPVFTQKVCCPNVCLGTLVLLALSCLKISCRSCTTSRTELLPSAVFSIVVAKLLADRCFTRKCTTAYANRSAHAWHLLVLAAPHRQQTSGTFAGQSLGGVMSCYLRFWLPHIGSRPQGRLYVRVLVV